MYAFIISTKSAQRTENLPTELCKRRRWKYRMVFGGFENTFITPGSRYETGDL